MPDAEERLKALEERVERLERQVAALPKRDKPAASTSRSREYRDRFDALDYPER